MIISFIFVLVLLGWFAFSKINRQRNINIIFLSTLEYFRKNPRKLFSEFTNQEYFKLSQLPDIKLRINIFNAIIEGIASSTSYSEQEIIEITSKNSTVFLMANQEIEMIIENMRKQAEIEIIQAEIEMAIETIDNINMRKQADRYKEN